MLASRPVCLGSNVPILVVSSESDRRRIRNKRNKHSQLPPYSHPFRVPEHQSDQTGTHPSVDLELLHLRGFACTRSALGRLGESRGGRRGECPRGNRGDIELLSRRRGERSESGWSEHGGKVS